MAAPSSYTEKQLGLFVAAALGPTATAIGWTIGDDDAGDFSEIVNDSLGAYGVATIDLATDIEKVRAIARWQAWRWAADALASRYNTSIGDQSLQRTALFDHAEKQRDYWHGQAMPYLTAYTVTATPVVHLDDPIDAPGRYAALRGW